jgi:hypothetical protein
VEDEYMARRDSRALLDEDAEWRLWVKAIYGARRGPFLERLNSLPVKERYRELSQANEMAIIEKLREIGYSDADIERFKSERWTPATVLPEEAKLLRLGATYRVDRMHEHANDELDMLLIDGFHLLRELDRPIEMEEYGKVQEGLQRVGKRFNIYLQERDRRELREKRSRAGTDGATQRWKGTEAVRKAVGKFARRKDTLGVPIPPSELWPELYSALEDEELNPRDQGGSRSLTDPSDPAVYEYDGGSITYNAFREQIRIARNRYR